MTSCSGSGDRPRRPDVVLVVVDALRADHLSQFGYDRNTSGGIGDFVAGAATFADCSAPAPWTNPSVASILTGLHPARHRTNEFGAVLADELTTVAEVLRDSGWNTAAISFNPGVRSELNYHQGFDLFDEFLGKSSAYPHMEEMVGRVADWLEDRPPRPFFLYLHPMNVHGPYRVPAEARSSLLGRPPGREFRYYAEPMRGIMRRGELDLRSQISDAYLRSLVDKYDTAIRYSTDQLAELFALLRKSGVYDDALIIVTADHGEELFDHGGFSHGFSLHREVLHVPLFVKLPGQTGAVEVTTPVGLTDIMPTVLEVAGVSSELNLDGRSLAGLARGGVPGETSATLPRLSQTAWEGRCVARGITDRGFRLLEIKRNYEGLRNVHRLYDLADDPGELNDVSQLNPRVARRLLNKLRQDFDALEAGSGPEPENRRELLDEERLRALGYVE